jgi:MFS family permease
MKSRAALGWRFWRLWSATAVSSLGDGMLMVTLPLLATKLTTDERLVAGVAVAETAPWLLFAVLAGTIADRRSYRQVLVAADVARAVIVAFLAGQVLTDRLTMGSLLLAAFGLGVCRPAFEAAAFRAVPSVVDDASLTLANGYMEATLTVGDEIAGRAIGGLLYSFAASIPIVGDAISFLLSAVLLRTLPPDEPLVDPTAPRRSIRADIAEGFRWFVGNRLILVLTAVVAGLAIAQSMVVAVLVLISQQSFGLSSRGFGLLLSCMSVAGVAGSLGAERLLRRFGRKRILLSAIPVVSAMYFVAWSTPSVVIAALAFSVQVAAISTANVVVITIRQQVIPLAVMGRVSSVIRTLVGGALPIGSVIGGLLAHRFGIRSPMLVAALLSLAAGAIGGPALARQLDES